MRLLHAGGQVVHAAYCTNVHGGEDLETIVGQLDRYALPVREHLGSDLLGLGLWLSAPVARELADDPGLVDRLRGALSARGLEVVTLNGFPYRGFQEPVVKHRVYSPDWTDSRRLDYTLDLAAILARLLPDDIEGGSISTLPLGWRDPWTDEMHAFALGQLDRLATGLHALRERTGRSVRVGFEPEPGCVVETTEQAVDRLAELDHDVLGVCLDLCHLAVQFEDADASVAALTRAAIPVVKAQVSAALHAEHPHDPATRAVLERFDEERFLHQVRERRAAGGLRSRDDLGDALRGSGALTAVEDADDPWRVHFHVPVGSAPEPPLAATTADLRRSLEVLVGGASPVTTHLEVETYTWTVLPERARPGDDAALAHSIAGELAWLRDTLVDLGLKECP